MSLLIETLKNLSPSSPSYRADASSLGGSSCVPGPIRGLCIQLHRIQSSNKGWGGRGTPQGMEEPTGICPPVLSLWFCPLPTSLQDPALFVLKEKIHSKKSTRVQSRFYRRFLGGNEVGGGFMPHTMKQTT